MLDHTPLRERQQDAFRGDVVEGLSRMPKSLPSRWLYDDRGSDLFEQITALEDYYPTRIETGILQARSAEIADFVGPGATLIEYGAGAGIKTEIVLRALQRPRVYVPIDIAGDFLDHSARRIKRGFEDLTVRPVVADFTQDFDLPADVLDSDRRCGFFPGSTIGNLDGAETTAFLNRMRRHVGDGGKAMIGIDLKKDLEVLRRAYDDRQGVTAAFNLNILARINRELGGTFQIGRFTHEVRWNEAESAVEMHLRSNVDQTVTAAGMTFRFREGETIHTESSRKYTVDAFAAVAGACGWTLRSAWTDARELYAVVGLQAAA